MSDAGNGDIDEGECTPSMRNSITLLLVLYSNFLFLFVVSNSTDLYFVQKTQYNNEIDSLAILMCQCDRGKLYLISSITKNNI